jgi:hypothetical protein
VGQSPLSAVGTGREMGEDLLNDLGLLDKMKKYGLEGRSA